MQIFAPLAKRAGARPQTTNYAPHEQLDQISPPAMQQQLWQLMQSLDGVSAAPSAIGPHGSRSLWLNQSGAPRDAFMVGREFVHLHPAHDGSLHMTLSHAQFEQACAAGWAEAHPLAPRGPQGCVALVYGPRDQAELEVVWQLVQQSYAFARGLAA